ncbi:MAG: hypothetical protein A2498_09955 [Lentisphaerae bacterium RIFOXYC12_FULL_60_16]|nr:MAG: hypothetical protein A2498_09955 [Lentisphaerae bacterium RIFOXYC12_FULL_60_16]
MKTYTVTFLPDNKTVSAARGKTLLEAAEAAGVTITSVCAGDGVCGKCRVLVKSGKVTAQANIFLDRREIQRGMALACQTSVEGDVVVEVPIETRIGGVPQLASEDAVRFSRPSELVGEKACFPHNPLCRKVFLDLPPPTITDCLSDKERVFREIRRVQPAPVMQMGLAVLRRLPGVLRDGEWKLTAMLGWRGETLEVVDMEAGDVSDRNFGVAVDIGTTTVVAHLVNLNTSETLSAKAKYNSQIPLGEDVIARIMCASNPLRREKLKELIVDDINDLVAALVQEAGIRLSDVTFILCAGNTTMIHLLLALDPSNIRREPYVPAVRSCPTVRASEVGISIHPRGLLSTLPCVASYVGGDVVADVLVSGMTRSPDLSLLIDLGTNGELVLGNNEWLVCCSASAGPAFEGGGIRCGMHATRGAIERINLAEGGRVVDRTVVDGGKPLGLCGSGLIDVVGELLRIGCIDRRGRYMPDRCGDRLRIGEADEPEFVLFPSEETALGRDIVLTESDIQNLIRSKGSVFMGAECLLDYVDGTFEDVRHVYIAGGFGSYLRIPRAIDIGLLPDLPLERFRFVGNGSVQGAKMALLSREALKYAEDHVADMMTYLELSTHHKYIDGYSSCLFLPHTDIEKFPSVMKGKA